MLLPADMHEPYGSVTTVDCCPPGTILQALAHATKELNRRVLSRAGEVPEALLMSAILSCLRVSGCISSWLDKWLDKDGRPVSHGKLPRVAHLWALPWFALLLAACWPADKTACRHTQLWFCAQEHKGRWPSHMGLQESHALASITAY